MQMEHSSPGCTGDRCLQLSWKLARFCNVPSRSHRFWVSTVTLGSKSSCSPGGRSAWQCNPLLLEKHSGQMQAFTSAPEDVPRDGQSSRNKGPGSSHRPSLLGSFHTEENQHWGPQGLSFFPKAAVVQRAGEIRCPLCQPPGSLVSLCHAQLLAPLHIAAMDSTHGLFLIPASGSHNLFAFPGIIFSWGWGMVSKMIQAHYISCVLYFYYYISSTQIIRHYILRLWTPALSLPLLSLHSRTRGGTFIPPSSR